MESGKEDLEAETKGSAKDAPQRICKKCLLREMQEGEYFRNKIGRAHV